MVVSSSRSRFCTGFARALAFLLVELLVELQSQTEIFLSSLASSFASGLIVALMIGDFFVLGSPTSATQSRADFRPFLGVLLHHQLDAVGDRGRAYRQRRHRDAAGVDAHRLGLREGVVLDQFGKQAARQHRRFEVAPEIDRALGSAAKPVAAPCSSSGLFHFLRAPSISGSISLSP